MTSHPPTNGLMPESAEAQLIALLDATVDELQERHDRLKSELAEVTAKLTGYRKLQGVGAAPAPKPKKPVAPARGRGSAEMRERILAALADAGEPISGKAIAEQIGVSDATVYTVLNVLREEEQVRWAGKGDVERGTPPRLWALFPGGDEVAA